MSTQARSPGAVAGALLGAALTAAQLAIMSLGHLLAGLAFPPFSLFDWTSRHIPGPLITFGIDSMVSTIRALGIGEISQAAKAAEQTLAVVGVMVLGALAGAVLFALLRRWRGRWSGAPAGAAFGGLLALLLLPVILRSDQASTASPWANIAWILLAYAAWGAVLGRAWLRLAGPATTPVAAAVAGEAGVSPVAVAEAVDRRRFMVRLGGATALVTVAGASVSAWLAGMKESARRAASGVPWSATHPLPNADATVQPVPGTRPELTPVANHYRIDINTSPPVLNEATWRLQLSGLVEQPRSWTLAELRQDYPPLDQFITLACISNPIAGSLTSTQRWTGVPLLRLLDQVRRLPAATHLRIHSADDFHETLAIADAMADERIMLTYAWDGLPLPTGHGFPLRIYRPDRYGMKQPKWITSIEAIAGDEDGYWVERGWDRVARMRTTSVIDTVGVDMMLAGADDTTIIPVGGIAHAGARGISRVEVQVDDGEWQPAELRDPLSDRTWVLWRFAWPFRPGEHTFTVRCFEGDGTPQIATRSPVRPSGATGLHHEEVML